MIEHDSVRCITWAHLLPGSDFGGCEVLAMRVANELASDRHVFLLPDFKGPIAKELRARGYKIVDTGPVGPKQYKAKSRREFLNDCITSLEVDVVVAWMGWPAVPVLQSLPVMRDRVFLAHGASVYRGTPSDRLRSRLYKILNVFKRKNADCKFVTCSQKVSSSYEDSPYLRSFRRVVVLNGIPIPRTIRWRPEAEDANRKIGMVARLDRAKDHDTLLRAMSLIDQNVSLEVIGDGPRRQELEDLTVRLGIAHRVSFLGSQQNPEEFVRAWSCAIFAGTEVEGFGLSVAEGMALGVPTIASSAGGIPEVIEDAGILFEPSDYTGLARLVEHVLSDSSYAASLSTLGYARACSHLSIQRCARQWRAVARD